MRWKPEEILTILDRCCPGDFPMLDNGYVYLAASRLSLYRSQTDWGMVVEVFGYSPRSGFPDIQLYTFASVLHDRNPPEKYANRRAYENYITNHPHNDSRFVYPLGKGNWLSSESYDEFVADNAVEVLVRDRTVKIPATQDYARHGIELQESPRARVFELCRFLADVEREQVLTTPSERRISILPDMHPLLQLERWNHPDTANDRLPSQSQTFQQLAQVLVTGDVGLYQPQQPNTHWRNWPEGGTL